MPETMIVGIMPFREKLRLLVVQRRFKGYEMAEAADVSESQYNAWVSDSPKAANRKPGYMQLLLLARKLDVTMESLADDALEPQPTELPADEIEVLKTYRLLRDVEGLSHTQVINRMNRNPVVEPRGSRFNP